ncbi:MAG: flagellar basal body P-ring protein FlgI [Phycisphaerales bacterium]|nr:MAG: flagellar basal body P-ring protein FlgI [Phycisphaerales bacterium]
MQIGRTGIIAIAMLVFAAGLRADEVTCQIADITHLKGQQINRLVGMGLVVGLNGTGDGDDYAPSMRALAEALQNLAAPVVSLDELKDSKNVALAFVEVTVPDNGVREGDRLDVQVSTFGGASSLQGGRLLPAPLVHHDTTIRTLFGFAGGPVRLIDENIPTRAIVEGGAVMEEDVLLGYLVRGRDLPYTNDWIEPGQQYVTFVLDDRHASWAMAHEVAVTIDSELALAADVDHVAMAVDPKNILVAVPDAQVASSWIRDIEMLQLLVPNGEARVTINRHTGTIVVSGNAALSPVVVSQKGMTVTILPLGPEGTDPGAAALSGPQTWVGLDPSQAGGTTVNDLLGALNRLSVPVEDRVAILTEIHRLGKLHAKLLFEE